MEFISERTAFTMISETVVKAGVSLFNAMKYIYMIADKDLYNINIKDIFRISLNNITTRPASTTPAYAWTRSAAPR